MRKDAILVAAVVVITGVLLIAANVPATPSEFIGNITITGNLNVTGTGEFGDGLELGGDLNMSHNYVIESDFSHWLHFTIEGDKADENLTVVPAGLLIQDRHFHRITLTVNTAPGGGESCNVTLTDDTYNMTVSLMGVQTNGWTETGEFDWDVSADTLILKYSQTAGGASTKAYITIKYYYKETP